MIYLYITKTLLLMSGKQREDDKREKRRTVSKLLHAFPGGSVVRICLPMQETQVWLLTQEDPTCCKTTKPMLDNY